MSCSEDETNAASVLSQLSQTAQQSEAVVAQHIGSSAVIAHQCDVETTTNQEIGIQVGDLGVDEALAASSTVSGLCDDSQPKIQTTLAASTVKVYPCEYCGKVFNKSYNLKTHHRVHSGERPYQCAVCSHGFANLGDLKRHDRTHTGEKPYTCEFCSKSFSDFGSHKRHLRLHTGYKPFKCDKCDREFTRLDSYKNHIRLHTGVRPYKCDECGKEFNYLTTYKRHQNIHSGERPYACDLCGKKFTRLIYVRNHKLSNCKREKSKDKEAPISDTKLVTSTCDVNELGAEQDSSTIKNITHDVSLEAGVQLNLAKVIYTNGGTQPVLIESGDTNAAHTLILTTKHEDGQQLLQFTADVNGEVESSVSQDSAGNIFFTQSLPAFSGDSQQQVEEGQHLVKEEAKTDKDGHVDGESSKITLHEEEASASDPRAMYIALDPTQEISGELHVPGNSFVQ